MRTWLIFVFIPLLLSGQNKVADTGYIESFYKQLNMRLEISSENENFQIEQGGEHYKIVPNLQLRYALGFNYKFATIKFGFRPEMSESDLQDKGDSYIFSFRAKLLFQRWAHNLDYVYLRGFYVDESSNPEFDKEPDNYYAQFPRLKTKIFNGSSLYKFNPNYSLRATQSQTEVQTRSAGTVMAGLEYSLYSISGTEKFNNNSGEQIERERFSEYAGFYTAITAGYYYTYVYKKYWYAGAFASPGLGMNFYEKDNYENGHSKSEDKSDLVLTMKAGLATGYSAKKFYAGLYYNYNLARQNSDEDLQIMNTHNNFNIFVGYRFNPPKSISKPIDQLEEKIPLIPEDKNMN